MDIFEACRAGHIERVRQLIDNGISVETINNFGATPLRYASSYGHKEICELLIENGADVNAKDMYKSTSLFSACYNEHKEICELLIENGADVNAKNNGGEIALLRGLKGHHGLMHYAGINKMYCELTLLMIKNGMNVNIKDNRGITLLMIASHYKFKEICELLIENGAEFEQSSFKRMIKNRWNDLCLKYLNITAFNRRKHLLASYDCYW